MSDIAGFSPEDIPNAANAPSFVPKELSDVLSRTHEAVGNTVDIREYEAKMLGVGEFLLRVGKVLHWFRKDATTEEVAEYAALVDAFNVRRAEIVEAANDSTKVAANDDVATIAA